MIFFAVLFIIFITIVIVVAYEKKSDKEAETIARNLNTLVKSQGGNVARSISYIQYPVRYRVVIDDGKKELHIFSGSDFEKRESVPFSDVLGFEAFKSGKSSVSIGKAIVGGVVAGGVGALIGAQSGAKEKLSSYTALLYRKDLSHPSYEFNFKLSGMDQTSATVENADRFVADLSGVIRSIVLQYSN